MTTLWVSTEAFRKPDVVTWVMQCVREGETVEIRDDDGTVRMVISRPAPDPKADPLAEPSVAVSKLRDALRVRPLLLPRKLIALIREAEAEEAPDATD